MTSERPQPMSDREFVDGVMRQIATRPLPKRSFWRRLLSPREVTLRVRPPVLVLGAVALALLGLLVRPHRAVERSEAVVVRFALAAPDARAVSLAGDFNGWRPETTPLTRGADGVWMVQLPLQRGTFSYSFVVDGKWVEDPMAESWRADGFGGRNAVVRVGEMGSARGG
jgi:hypothetical protein